MHRDMSYRKPVPTYTPSPPGSTSCSPVVHRSLSVATTDQGVFVPGKVYDSHQYGDIMQPQLPCDWRENIARATTVDRCTKILSDTADLLAAQPKTNPCQLHHTTFSVCTASPGDLFDNISYLPQYVDFTGGGVTYDDPLEEALLSRKPSTLSHASNRRYKRKLHQVYRPPTPPIPSFRGLPEDERVLPPAFGRPESIIGDVPEKLHTTSQRPSTKMISCTPLRTTLSYRTEKTLASYVTVTPSTTWSGGSKTLLSEPDSEGPLLPMYFGRAPPVGSKKAKARGTASGPSLWERVGTWGKGKLRSFRDMVGL